MSNKSITDIGNVNIGGSTVSIEELLKEGPVSSPTEEQLEAEETVRQEDIIAEDLYSTPIEMWKQECESIGLDLPIAAHILDAIMTNGFYEGKY